MTPFDVEYKIDNIKLEYKTCNIKLEYKTYDIKLIYSTRVYASTSRFRNINV